MSTVKQISSLAKKIRAKKPSMKWTDAIKAASKELKASGKIGTKTAPKKRTTVRATKKRTTVGATKKRTTTTPKTKPKQIRRKVGETHKDTKSHNVRINVLSGAKSRPIVLNGITRLIKGKYYLWVGKEYTGTLPYTNFKGAIMLYEGMDKKTFSKPLMFKVWYKKTRVAGYHKPDSVYLPNNLPMSSFELTKKPTSAQLAIGHLKL